MKSPYYRTFIGLPVQVPDTILQARLKLMEILREENIPDDFKYLAMAESGFQNLTSSKGATGYWQFMKSAALERGLTINSEIDESYHV